MAASAIRTVHSFIGMRPAPAARRWPTGGVVAHFETRLAARFDEAAVAAFQSPVEAIAAALAALDCERASACVIPAWGPPDLARAVRRAGLEPWPVDVDLDSWMLEPEAALGALATHCAPIAAFLPCAAFGRLPDLDAWAQVVRSAGVPVLVNAVGAFDGLTSTPVPVVASAIDAEGHAAGAFVASADAGLISRVTASGGSAQLPEPAAAAGLVALDAWPQTRARLAIAAQNLKVALALTPQIAFQPGWGSRWLSNVCVVGAPDGAAAALAGALAARGVETRSLWELGCETSAGLSGCLRHSAPGAEHLAASTLELPFCSDLDEAACWRIVDALLDALKEI
ncbi:MAG TPA: DegT/DnrJ/EryC1/StrS family aminotransferase [Caulobacteraceae bacterium]|nr:DegT/DnrJ/EryC1/StrS family aminotransferase [Caulobacteraceae bacterium]